MGAIVFIDFVVFKDHLIAISRYLHTPCADRSADQVYYYYCDNISEISLFYFWNIIIMKELSTLENFNPHGKTCVLLNSVQKVIEIQGLLLLAFFMFTESIKFF